MDEDIPPLERSDTSPSQQDAALAQRQNGERPKPQSSSKGRKRTKTGCLTCRRRRIKCGEERPLCGNCIKSKRTCEGYAPRLTFKDPISAMHSPWGFRGPGFPYANAPSQGGAAGQFIRPVGADGSTHFPVIAPRPTPSPGFPGPYYGHPDMSSPAGLNPTHGLAQYSFASPVSAGPNGSLVPHFPGSSGHGGFPEDTATPRNGLQSQAPTPLSGHGVPPPPVETPEPPHLCAGSQWLKSAVENELANKEGAKRSQSESVPPVPMHAANSDESDHFLYANGQEKLPHVLESHASGYPPRLQTSAEEQSWTSAAGGRKSPIAPTDNMQWYSASELQPINTTVSPHPEPPTASNYDQGEDEELYDVETDDESPPMSQYGAQWPVQPQQRVHIPVMPAGADRGLLSNPTFLRPGILTNYVPKFTSSPLMNPTAARIFCHFITSTGPTLSTFERRVVDPTAILRGEPVPRSQQSLWTYTLPMMALSNIGLLQSMLAISSLQIARLQQAPLTASMKHYHFALRKVAKAVATPSRRTSIPTIAATLILAHFEAITAEHKKWTSHLAGAAQLLMETDFAKVTRRIREEKQHHRSQSHGWYTPITPHPTDELPWVPDANGPDESLLSAIMGQKAQYDRSRGNVGEVDANAKPPLTQKDLDDFQTKRDLWWWFCKMDVIQSLVRGGPLLLSFDRWTHCSPRGRMGESDATYGTWDHLVLLLGRVSDFAYRDSIRKRQALQASGGEWRPPGARGSPGGPSGMSPSGGSEAPPQMPPRMRPGTPDGYPYNAPPPPAGLRQPSVNTSLPPGTQQPTPISPDAFYGMMPNAGAPQPSIPEAFAAGAQKDSYTPVTPHEHLSLAAATAKAEAEWTDLQAALNTFERALSDPAWAPLPTPSHPTAFGPGLQYRAPAVGALWSFYHTARLVHARTHPSMPPASMAAAGVAARHTAIWAHRIGRAALGLAVPPAERPLAPPLAAAVGESLLPLFFAGVQYVDPAQRVAVVARLRYIAARIGLDSASLIAAGLEMVWSRMAAAGRGPAYARTLEVTIQDSVNAESDSRRDGGCRVNRERGLVRMQPDTRLKWAAGVLSLEQDFSELSVKGGGGL